MIFSMITLSALISLSVSDENNFNPALVRRLLGKDPSDDIDCTPSDPVPVCPSNGPACFIQDICDGLYSYGNGGFNSMFMVTKTGVIWVDAPLGLAFAFETILSNVTSNPITTVIYSHHHADHIGGAAQLPNIDTAKIICLRETNSKILANPQRNIPPCARGGISSHLVRRKRVTVTDGGKTLALLMAGYNWHTDNDLIIYAKKQKTLMAIDVVFPGWLPFRFLGIASGSVDGYREVHNFFLCIDDKWENFIGGHVDRIGNRTDVQLNLDYVTELELAAQQATAETNVGEIAAQFAGQANIAWDFAQALQSTIARRCAEIMLGADRRWSTIWNGADVFMEDNCYWMYQHQVIIINNAD